jgi:type IV pilus assembly protein PilA
MFRRVCSAKRGFTLVEVIVVLVILAILAAIAIPALTGYIDKARAMEFKSNMDYFRKASQTLIVEEMAANGGQIKLYTTADNNATFESVTARKLPSTGQPADPPNQLYVFAIRDEAYKKLTGVSLYDVIGGWDGVGTTPIAFNVTTDSRGAIKMALLDYNIYFANDSGLAVYWFGYSANDPYSLYADDAKSHGSDIQKYIFSNATQGFNFYKTYEDVNFTWTSVEKLDW